jgi:nucleoside-diphosphate-sugar epimerase
MTVLVTGAAGFLGSHVTDVLVANGERPRALVRPGGDRKALAEAGLEVYSADIGNGAVFDDALRGVDRVIHCAARTGPWGPDAEYERVNVRGLETLVRAALAAGVRVDVVVTMPGSRYLERRLKRWKKTGQFCPVCRAARV